MGWRTLLLSVTLLAAVILPAHADSRYLIRTEAWTEADERGFGEFITAIGDSDCDDADSCLKSAANPFRASDPPQAQFRADCADLPYVLRFYYAWKRGLPFSYVAEVSPRGRARDARYSDDGNRPLRRRELPSGADALTVLARLFRLPFDPYHCVELRWGAVGEEAASCCDGAVKRAWYEAEMDFSLRELQSGKGGVASPPDTDTRSYLLSVLRERN